MCLESVVSCCVRDRHGYMRPVDVSMFLRGREKGALKRRGGGGGWQGAEREVEEAAAPPPIENPTHTQRTVLSY